MKVLLAIFAIALTLVVETADAVCTSTQGDQCLSKAEVSGIVIALLILRNKNDNSLRSLRNLRQLKDATEDTTPTEARALNTPPQKEKG